MESNSVSTRSGNSSSLEITPPGFYDEWVNTNLETDPQDMEMEELVDRTEKCVVHMDTNAVPPSAEHEN